MTFESLLPLRPGGGGAGGACVAEPFIEKPGGGGAGGADVTAPGHKVGPEFAKGGGGGGGGPETCVKLTVVVETFGARLGGSGGGGTEDTVLGSREE